MGIGRLVGVLLAQGRLVAPFAKSVTGSRSYVVIRSQTTGDRPHVKAFVDWLVEQAGAAAVPGEGPRVSSPAPEARSNGAKEQAR
jgi:hypothetical protein